MLRFPLSFFGHKIRTFELVRESPQRRHHPRWTALNEDIISTRAIRPVIYDFAIFSSYAISRFGQRRFLPKRRDKRSPLLKRFCGVNYALIGLMLRGRLVG